MVYLGLLYCLIFGTIAEAGVDFAALGGGKYVKYVEKLDHFKKSAYENLVLLKQPSIAMSDKATDKTIHAIEVELTELALEAGKTQDEDFVNFQEKLEDMMIPEIKEIKLKRRTKDQTYFSSVELAAKSLKTFKIPYVAGGSIREPGADFYAGSRPIK